MASRPTREPREAAPKSDAPEPAAPEAAAPVPPPAPPSPAAPPAGPRPDSEKYEQVKREEREGTVGTDEAHRQTESLQKTTDRHIAEVDRRGAAKEQEVLEV